MKAVINEKETQAKAKYPCLMKSSNGDIFYFVREGYGLPLADIDGGEWSYDQEDFADFSNNYRTFIPFTGSITLSND